jgi:hypothetical protein
MDLDTAGRRAPKLLELIRQRVKPYRETLKRAAYRDYWWRFEEPQFSMRMAISSLDRCIVSSQVSKHLLFSFQPSDRIFSHKLNVFPFNTYTPFAVLQSRVHEPWARLLSSTLETRLNYSATDCFETFPFPQADPRTVMPELEALGEKLYTTRARFMVDTNQGLTKTYNALKDPDNDDPRVLELRALHEEMDRAVLAAYGWTNIPVPPYCPKTDEDRAALQAFEDEVIDRLFVLNAERAAQEKQAAAASAPAPARTGRKTAAKKTAQPAKKTAARRPAAKSASLPGFEAEDDA